MFVHERFQLDESTVEELKGMKAPFGYNGFGEFLFYRTYSRTRPDGGQESWADCVIRVMNGVLSIRKDWYIKNSIWWDDAFWSHYGRQMAVAMFLMKWLPPGRGLWAMGTDFVYERGGMALNNCGLKVVGSDIGADVHWIMDALMCGVGTGFIPEPDDDFKTYIPAGTYDYTIPDTREGWCDATQKLIDSYVFPHTARPVFSYDSIRPAGLPIKGFGGISSGPEPLKYFHQQIEMFFEMYRLHDWYTVVMLKADIVNACGCCVVSGNVRRSAELMAGKFDDIADMKNYDMYPHRESHGGMSNNSVFLESDEDFQRLGELAERIKRNGEPGFINLRNLPFGRIGKPMNGLKIDKAIAFNPCLTSESKILTADGRGYVAIGELATIGNDLDVFCVDEKDQLCIRRMRNPRKTGENRKILKIVFDDGSSLRCTENHRIMLKDRSFVEAKDLAGGMSVAIVNRYNSKEAATNSYWSDYIQYGYAGSTTFEHRMIAEHKYHHLFEHEHVHHMDGNKKNNAVDNLEIVDAAAHLSNHGAGSQNPNYSGISHDELLQEGVELAKLLDRRFSQDEWNAHSSVDLNSKYRRDHFGSFIGFATLCADIAGVMNNQIDPRTLRLYQKAIADGYDATIDVDTVKVAKICEGCKQSFAIDYQQREQAVCSIKCGNTIRDYSRNAGGLRQAFASRRETLRSWQLDVYTKLKHELGRQPLRKEWQEACKADSLSCEIGRKGSPFQRWFDLVDAARGHNHKIVTVIVDGYEDVYNGTVDDHHNYIVKICDDESKIFHIERGIVTPQCGEQPLEDGEMCTLVETCPTMCESDDDWLKATEYATVYASTVTLLPTHRHETNAVMLRNRRIGVGIIDVVGWNNKIGTTNLIKSLREGYKRVRAINKWVNNEAGVPEAIRVTTIKPGGTTPKLPGLRSGWSWPTFGLTKRRVRVARNQPIHAILSAAGVPYEADVVSRNTDCFEWPIDQSEGGLVKPATEISLWQQAMMLVLLQREWSDNAVSNTLYFKPKWPLVQVINIGYSIYDIEPKTFHQIRTIIAEITGESWSDFLRNFGYKDERTELKMIQNKWTNAWELQVYRYDPHHEEDDVESVLAMIAPLTKSVSMLPHSPKGVYLQSPEEELTLDEYLERLSNMQEINWSALSGSEGTDERYCSGASCEVPVGSN